LNQFLYIFYSHAMVSFGRRLALIPMSPTLFRYNFAFNNLKLIQKSSLNKGAYSTLVSTSAASPSFGAYAETAQTSVTFPWEKKKMSTAAQKLYACTNEATETNTLHSDKSSEIITGFLNATDAYDLDQELFASGFTLEQLMELAGLSVAEAVYASLPPHQNLSDDNAEQLRILIVCGPGNNGGDGLVAARHLVMFGYDVTVVYPKRSTREAHYEKLEKQCVDVGVEILDKMPPLLPSGVTNEKSIYQPYDGIVDAMFGFSFKGEPREPFASAIKAMVEAQIENSLKNSTDKKRNMIISVDVPSGWNVNEGDVMNIGFEPDVLVSLTAPKLCSKSFSGRHFVGGRFLPPLLAKKYGIQMPPYPGVSQVMEII